MKAVLFFVKKLFIIIFDDADELKILNKLIRLKDSKATVIWQGKVVKDFEITLESSKEMGCQLNYSVSHWMELSDTLIEKSIQIITCADDIILITRDRRKKIVENHYRSIQTEIGNQPRETI